MNYNIIKINTTIDIVCSNFSILDKVSMILLTIFFLIRKNGSSRIGFNFMETTVSLNIAHCE